MRISLRVAAVSCLPYRSRPVRDAIWILCALALSAVAAPAQVLPEGFQEVEALADLDTPTAIRFAPDGKIFVAEKRGVVWLYQTLTDPAPVIVADVQAAVHNFWDRGLLGMAIDPDWPTQPYIYLLYAYDYDAGNPGAGSPRWGDTCPDPPGSTGSGCVVNGRLSRVEISEHADHPGTETALIENRWCQQYPSHSTGDLVFDPLDRVLYASAGDGASFNWVDYGQGGDSGGPIPPNPCGDPPGTRGSLLSPPDAEGGALRSQDIRTSGDEVSLDGTVIALDPDTGAPLSTNPLYGGDAGDDLLIAHGLRNPFRITTRPGTHEVWLHDTGWSTYEEVNRIPDTQDAVIENFGWPCYEGAPKQPGYDGQDLTLCENLYADTTNPATAPYYAYNHNENIDPDPLPFRCSKTGSSSTGGITFYTATAYPAEYLNGLFFADYSRDCLYFLPEGTNGLPDVAARTAFMDGAANPADLQVGPDGNLYYVDVNGGRVLRIEYHPLNEPPVAVAAAAPTSGPLPLNVQFDATGSSDPDPGATLTYEWDLDGDGNLDDGTAALQPFAYTAETDVDAVLRVTDELDGWSEDTVRIVAGNSVPAVTIVEPASSLVWAVGDTISFSGTATDPDEGTLPASAFRWKMILYHCPGGPDDCHVHDVEERFGVDSGTFTAPDHEYYSYLVIELSVQDSGFSGGGGVLEGLDSVRIEPDTVDLDFETDPMGLDLAIGSTSNTTPFARTVIRSSLNTITAPAIQDDGIREYQFNSWSDGGGRSHEVVGEQSSPTYVAYYDDVGPSRNWWDPDWRHRQKLVFDNSGQTENLVDFPMLVVLDAGVIDYSLVQNAGEDLRFVDEDGLTVLAHEIERWDEAGTSYVWVRVPQIDASSTSDHVFLYYGHDQAPDAQQPDAVWSNGYVGVWHLAPDLLDSSSHTNNGTDHGTTDRSGRIGRARELDGTDWIDAGSDSSLQVTGQLTIEAWVAIDDPNGAGAQRVLSKKPEWNSGQGYNLEYKPTDNNVTNVTSGSNYGRADGIDLDTSWHWLAATVDGTAATIYVDGIDETDDGVCDALVAGPQALNIGRRSGVGDYYVGGLDEVRLSDVARSAAWIRAQHLSMTGTFAGLQAGEDNCRVDDLTCNAWDDDCDGTLDEDFASEPTGCGVGECVSAGVTSCVAGVVADSCVPGSPVAETCDGLDNDCNGVPDDPPVPTLATGLTVTRTDLSWPLVAGATGYDIVRGSIATLRSTGGDYATATEACVAANHTGTTLPYADAPGMGEAQWLLVRASNCGGAGTYDSGAPEQIGVRDAEIEAAGASCP